MVTLLTAGSANATMRSMLKKSVTPDAIAGLSACSHFFLARERLATLTGGRVSSLMNLADAAAPLGQATEAKRPVFADDATLGRKTLFFDTDLARELTAPAGVDYSAAYTMLCVLRTPAAVGAAQSANAWGRTSSATAASAYIGRDTTGKLRVYHGTGGFVQITNPDDEWIVCMMAHDGAGNIAGRFGADDWVSDAYTANSVATALNMGQNASNGFSGHIDMAAFISADLSSPDNLATLDDLRAMIDGYYGGLLAV